MTELRHSFTFWTVRRSSKKANQAYIENMTCLGTVGTVEEFWAFYSFLKRPAELPVGTDVCVFRQGIKPMWEDKLNKHGGKWITRLRKTFSSRCWEDLLLALIGGQFPDLDAICGICCTTKGNMDVLAVWIKECSDEERDGVRTTMRSILHVPQSAMEYRKHDTGPKEPQLVSIRSASGRYMSVSPGGAVTCSATKEGPAEKWVVLDEGDDSVSIKSAQGTFLSATADGTVVASNDSRRTEQMFKLTRSSNGSVSLRSHYGLYLSDKNGTIECASERIDFMEQFGMLPARATEQ